MGAATDGGLGGGGANPQSSKRPTLRGSRQGRKVVNVRGGLELVVNLPKADWPLGSGESRTFIYRLLLVSQGNLFDQNGPANLSKDLVGEIGEALAGIDSSRCSQRIRAKTRSLSNLSKEMKRHTIETLETYSILAWSLGVGGRWKKMARARLEGTHRITMN